MNQYPHTVKIASAATTTVDSSGNYAKPSSTTLELEGRYEEARSSAIIQASDGTMVNYSGIIYIPYSESPVKLGTVIEVYNSRESLIAKGTVKLYLEGEVLKKNARIWL